MKVRTRSQQLKWRLQPRRGRNARMDALLRSITGSPGYSASSVRAALAGLEDLAAGRVLDEDALLAELEFEPQPANIALRSTDLT